MKSVRTMLPACAVLGLLVLVGSTGDAAASRPAIFTTHTGDADVYVNPLLARAHPEARYLPLVIGVVNNDATPVQLTRNSFSIEYGGTVHRAVTVAELRRHYTKLDFDARQIRQMNMVRILGLNAIKPVPSNFYPIIRKNSAVTTEIVELPRRYDMWDVLYFKRPAGLRPGATFTVRVTATGWAKPVAVTVTL